MVRRTWCWSGPPPVDDFGTLITGWPYRLELFYYDTNGQQIDNIDPSNLDDYHYRLQHARPVDRGAGVGGDHALGQQYIQLPDSQGGLRRSGPDSVGDGGT